MSAPIRVLVVDDSAFQRYTIAKYLDTDAEINVVGSACDGLDTLNKMATLTPDVVTLDVEMPRMDGLTTLEHIMKDYPTPVVMLSSLTRQGAQTTIQALLRGAVDFVSKPAIENDTRLVFKELIAKVKTAAKARPYGALPRARSRNLKEEKAQSPAHPPPFEARKPGLKPFRRGDPLVVIGSSTGGPRALQQVFSDFPADLPAAVIVVQHMPAGFTRSLAQRLNDMSPLTVQEAAYGDRLARGLALLAPGDFHLRLKTSQEVVLDQGPRRNHVRPAVDVSMESAVKYHQSAVIGVVLTGMGADGTAGAAAIKRAGGRVVAEHESTCVVYGMPRSVVEANLSDRVVPLSDVASTLVEMVSVWKPGNIALSNARY